MARSYYSLFAVLTPALIIICVMTESYLSAVIWGACYLICRAGLWFDDFERGHKMAESQGIQD